METAIPFPMDSERDEQFAMEAPVFVIETHRMLMTQAHQSRTR